MADPTTLTIDDANAKYITMVRQKDGNYKVHTDNKPTETKDFTQDDTLSVTGKRVLKVIIDDTINPPKEGDARFLPRIANHQEKLIISGSFKRSIDTTKTIRVDATQAAIARVHYDKTDKTLSAPKDIVTPGPNNSFRLHIGIPKPHDIEIEELPVLKPNAKGDNTYDPSGIEFVNSHDINPNNPKNVTPKQLQDAKPFLTLQAKPTVRAQSPGLTAIATLGKFNSDTLQRVSNIILKASDSVSDKLPDPPPPKTAAANQAANIRRTTDLSKIGLDPKEFKISTKTIVLPVDIKGDQEKYKELEKEKKETEDLKKKKEAPKNTDRDSNAKASREPADLQKAMENGIPVPEETATALTALELSYLTPTAFVTAIDTSKDEGQGKDW